MSASLISPLPLKVQLKPEFQKLRSDSFDSVWSGPGDESIKIESTSDRDLDLQNSGQDTDVIGPGF